MEESLKESLLLFKKECVARLGERVKRIVVAVREKKVFALIVAEELNEREEYKLYRATADFALKAKILLFVFPYSSFDFRRRESLAFIQRILKEGEEL
jgi:hypothetical protein